MKEKKEEEEEERSKKEKESERRERREEINDEPQQASVACLASVLDDQLDKEFDLLFRETGDQGVAGPHDLQQHVGHLRLLIGGVESVFQLLFGEK